MHRRQWPRARAKCPARQSTSRAAQRAACGSPTRAGTPFWTSLKLSGAERHATPGSGLGCPLHVARGRFSHLRRAQHQTAAAHAYERRRSEVLGSGHICERIGWLQLCFSPELGYSCMSVQALSYGCNHNTIRLSPLQVRGRGCRLVPWMR